METTHLWVKGKGGRAQPPSAPPTQRLRGHLTRPMVSSLAQLCVHHMRLVRFPFLGLSVVTEAWQVEVGEFRSQGGEDPQSQVRGGRPRRRRQKTDSVAAAWAQGKGVAPKGQRNRPEAVWIGWGGATERRWLSRKWEHVRGTGDLSGEVMEINTQEGREPCLRLDLTWCVGMTGAEGIRCRDSRLWRSLCSSWSLP